MKAIRLTYLGSVVATALFSLAIFTITLNTSAQDTLPIHVKQKNVPPLYEISSSNAMTLFATVLCIDLQGTRSTANDEPISYDIIDPSGSVVVSGSTGDAIVEDDDTGCFQIEAVAPGVYDVALLSSTPETDYLTNLIYGINIVGWSYEDGEEIYLTESGANAVLLEGDANSDNTISGADVSVLVSTLRISFPLCEGDEGYDARADFNEDGCITGVDSSILVSNLNIFIAQKGDAYP